MAMRGQLLFVTAFFILPFSLKAQKKYALLIGINDYYEVKGIKSKESLHGSVNDANSIKDLLIKKFGFKKTDIDTIYDADATRDNIIAGLKKKLKQCRPGDAMVFYYSGHGVWMNNSDEAKDPIKKGMNQAMLTSDLYNYDDHLKCFLRDFTLKEYFNLFVDKKIVLTTIFDCCFSGNLAMANRGANLSEKEKSVDVMELLGRLTLNAKNTQLLIDSIAGIPINNLTGCPADSNKIKNLPDTDGDGVPDCRDKEKFTNKKCFPVDDDGVGNCPVDYIFQTFTKTLNKYDSAELGTAKNPFPQEAMEKAFSATAVLSISEKDTIKRPVDRKNSKFLFISATTDLQKAVEFNDEQGVRHSFFTASIMRVFNKCDANTSVEDLFQKIVDDMNSYHRNQNPTLYSDPERKKSNLLGMKR